MKTCNSCGSQIEDKALFCPDCGAQQAGGSHTYDGPGYGFGQEGAGQQEYGNQTYGNQTYGNQTYSGQGFPNQGYQDQGGYGYMPAGVRERNIVLCIILSLVTCGLYGIYWMVCLTDDINLLSNEPRPTTGVMTIVFSLLTCGIYGLYWNYKMGSGVDRIKGTDGNTGLLYLVLAIFGLGIVNFVLMQDTINNALSR